ncbi:unnamed protein product [Penicillium bialowiezense]
MSEMPTTKAKGQLTPELQKLLLTKTQCDGKVPICGPCAAVEATCVMSDRLMVQHANNCECDSLRTQLAAAERRATELSQKCHQLEFQIAETLKSVPPTISDIPTSSSPMIAQTATELCLLNGQLSGMNRSSMSSAWELWGDDTDMEMPESNRTGLDRDAYVNLATEFFDKRWPYLPVLHRQSFFDQHLIPFLNQRGMGPLSNFLVNVVCAIASTETSNQQKGHEDSRAFFREAVKDLHLVMASENFECIQCLLLMCIYGHNEPQSVNIWYTIGLALNLAIGINLHRKESISTQDTMTAEMCKRVFWCAYVINCSMAINMGRPLGIQESDISMPLPLQMTDTQLDEASHSPHAEETFIPHVADTSTFIHIIKLRRINAAVYTTFHSIGSRLAEAAELDRLRSTYFMELNQWRITAPLYIQPLSTFQSTEWFQIAYHHAVLSLYRPSRAIPLPSPDNLRLCTDSAIGLISSYSALYARNRIRYTFVAIHSLFMAAVTMLYSLRAFAPLRRELTKPVIRTNIFTFLTLFRGICDGRTVGEKCCGIVERLGDSILSIFDNEDQTYTDIDTEFQTWFGLQTHTFPSQASDPGFEPYPHGSPSHFPDVSFDLPWADLFTQGIDMGTADVWSFVF